MTSFLNNIASFMKLIPDHRPHGLADQIRPKCRIVHFPIQFPDWCKDNIPMTKPTCLMHMKQSTGDGNDTVGNGKTSCDSKDEATSNETQCNKMFEQCHLAEGSDTTDSTVRPLHIVWPHRWEHDKRPDVFFHTLYELQKQGLSFNVSVLGETYSDVPDIFAEAAERLKTHIVAWGFQPSKDDYYHHLVAADVVVSTAVHEFFGVAMLEAAYLGCYPLCPRRLVYPEIFPDECLYNTDNQLLKRLVQYCKRPTLVRHNTLKIDLDQYSWQRLRSVYEILLTTHFDDLEPVQHAPS